MSLASSPLASFSLIKERRVKKPESVAAEKETSDCIDISLVFPILFLLSSPPKSHGIPFSLPCNHPTAQYFPGAWPLLSQRIQRSLSRQSDSTRSASNTLHFSLNARCEKNKTILHKGVTRRADHKEMGESALYFNILCSATPLSSQTPMDASTGLLKGSYVHHPGTVISHTSCGSLHPHTKKNPPH